MIRRFPPAPALAALLAALTLMSVPAAAAGTRPSAREMKKEAKGKVKPPSRPRVKNKAVARIDESTAPTKPRARISAEEKAAFRDAFVAGVRGRHKPEPSLVEALASDLADFYATRQITADEVNGIRDALVAYLSLPAPGPADLDGLSGRVNAITERSSLDIGDMENVAAAARAVAESVRIEPAAKREPEKRERKRNFFRRLFGR